MKKLITESVNRFLGWKLPSDFAPDAGITFKRDANPDSPIELQYKHEPTGTNLFHAGQVEAMLLHIAKPLTDKIEALESDLEIQTKVFIAACEDLSLIAEKLGIDPEDGGASPILDRITELQAQLQQHQWQPIETAPKDDDTLLLLANNEGVWVGKYCPVYQSGFKPSNPWSSMLLNHDHIRFHKSSMPTHYMPLPAAPAIQAEGKQA